MPEAAAVLHLLSFADVVNRSIFVDFRGLKAELLSFLLIKSDSPFNCGSYVLDSVMLCSRPSLS